METKKWICCKIETAYILSSEDICDEPNMHWALSWYFQIGFRGLYPYIREVIQSLVFKLSLTKDFTEKV